MSQEQNNDDDDRDFSVSFDLPQPRNVIEHDVLGRRRTFAGLEGQEWAFLIVSCVNIFIVIGLTLERLVITWTDEQSFDFTYSLLLLISALFCVFYVFNGVLRERQYEVYAFVAAVLLVLVYCTFDYVWNIRFRNDIKLIRLIIGGVLAPINIMLALIVARRFGWLEFRIVGAAEALQQMYRQLCFFFTLQRFDLQASASFLILIVKNGTFMDFKEQLTLAIGIPLLIVTFVVGFLAVQKELRAWLALFVFLNVVVPAYVLFKLIELYGGQAEMTSCLQMVTVSCVHMYSVICVGFLVLLVRFVLLFELYAVYQNFGYGLTERAFTNLVDSEKRSLLGRQRRRYT